MTANIKALLTSIRSMVVKMLPAYRFFTDRTTETTTTQICSGDVHSMLGAQIAFPEGAITSFVEGDVYNLTVNGETHQITVKKNDDGLLFFTGDFGPDANGNVSFPNNSGFGFSCHESGAECYAQGEYIGVSITLTKEDGTVVYSGTPEYSIVPPEVARKLNGNVLPTVGDTYDVEINGTVSQNQFSIVKIGGRSCGYLGTGTYDDSTAVLSPDNSWMILFGDTNPLYFGNGTFTNATVSVTQTKTVVVEHYDTKKLPEECLPNGVAKTKDVRAAKSAAAAAQSTANDAKTAAETAQTTANAAQATANAAQTTAENALERVVEPYTRNMQMAPLYKNGGFSAWRDVVQTISYNKTEGYFFVNSFDTTALKEEDMPKNVFCVKVYVGNQSATAFLTTGVKATGSGSWYVSGFAVITDKYFRTGEVLYVSSNDISQIEAKGLFLTFRAPDSMLLKSSTANSTKQFRITVDDSGVIFATDSDGTVYTLGAKGDKGDKGEPGARGEKGEKGDPYTLTDADKQTITNAVLAALPTWTGGDF